MPRMSRRTSRTRWRRLRSCSVIGSRRARWCPPRTADCPIPVLPAHHGRPNAGTGFVRAGASSRTKSFCPAALTLREVKTRVPLFVKVPIVA